jgi:hypothetical protein
MAASALHSFSSFRSQAMHPPSPGLGLRQKAAIGAVETMEEIMRVLTFNELMLMTRTELCGLPAKITAALPTFREGSPQRTGGVHQSAQHPGRPGTARLLALTRKCPYPRNRQGQALVRTMEATYSLPSPVCHATAAIRGLHRGHNPADCRQPRHLPSKRSGFDNQSR